MTRHTAPWNLLKVTLPALPSPPRNTIPSCIRALSDFLSTDPQMSAQSQQIKQNFMNHPYTQQANKFLSGQVNQLDAEVSVFSVFSALITSPRLLDTR